MSSRSRAPRLGMEIIKVETEEEIRLGAERAGDLILSGGVVALPTESFYALAVDAFNESAILRLLELKGRREDNPVLILIHSKNELERYVAMVPPAARRLMEAFWPGGLTMVFEAVKGIPAALTGGTGKIGIRVSSHPMPTALAGLVGGPITGTSANRSGEPACVSAQEVLHALEGGVDLILDGGSTPGGKGSTVLDVTFDPPRIVREGMITREELSIGYGLNPPSILV